MLGLCFSESGREGGGKEGSLETEEDEVGMESCVGAGMTMLEMVGLLKTK